MPSKIRHQLHLSQALSDRFEQLASKPGINTSAMLEEALEHWLTRRGHHDLDDRFGLRLDRITAALSRVERANQILLESLALFVRYELAIHPPLADTDHAGRAKGRERFQTFIDQVAQKVASGKPTLDARGETGK